MESNETDKSDTAAPHTTVQLARICRLSATIVGGLSLLVVAVNSQAATSGTGTTSALAAAAAIVGLIPMFAVAHGLGHNLPWRRNAALAYAPELEEVILPQTSDVLEAIQATARF